MAEIVCPNCRKAFKVDESSYANILKQVRDKVFTEQVQQMENAARKDKDNAVELTRLEEASKFQKEFAEKNSTIQELSSEIQRYELKKEMEVNAATTSLEKENARLSNMIDTEKLEVKNQLNELKNGHALAIKDLEGEVERLRDLKIRQSTKMLGESLEQHCSIEFERIRATAFPRAEFRKDNDVSSGSKGDYIFRDFDADGTEYISIMFDMKNESDETKTKKKNENFLKELDKDRTEKGCEYAVLVTLLEQESELYNDGIVEKCHLYEKMYVIRPQYFIQLISILRNAAMNSIQYRRELALAKAENIDITNFEVELESFKNSFAINRERATRKFEVVISEIDKSIERLGKAKEALLAVGNNLRIANDKAQSITVKRLTKDSPSLADEFQRLRDEGLDQA
ncbi:MAG: Uncharacterised protein [Prochlorococcus marinus str. MIT 9215]|nr:MAG: Uncharacterised protein [Prochlorococcus marinus str. MIT 9215]